MSKSTKYIDCTLIKWTNKLAGFYGDDEVLCIPINKSIDRIHNEALLRITYSNINFVRCYGFTVIDYQMFFVMEKTLYNLKYFIDQVSHERKKATSLLYIYDCARAIQYLHSIDSNCIHKNLTLESFEYSKNGICKLADFGTVGNSVLHENILHENTFLAPEVYGLVEGRTVSQALDIFSLGTVFWEILNPNEIKKFTGITRRPILTKQILPDEAVGLMSLMNKMWSNCISERPTIHEVVTDVDNVFYNTFKKIIDDLNITGMFVGSNLINLLQKEGYACSDIEAIRLASKLLEVNIIRYVSKIHLIPKKVLLSVTSATTSNVETSPSDDIESQESSLELDLTSLDFDPTKYYRVHKKHIDRVSLDIASIYSMFTGESSVLDSEVVSVRSSLFDGYYYDYEKDEKIKDIEL
jgi:serine/threonine protein kinase